MICALASNIGPLKPCVYVFRWTVLKYASGIWLRRVWGGWLLWNDVAMALCISVCSYKFQEIFFQLLLNSSSSCGRVIVWSFRCFILSLCWLTQICMKATWYVVKASHCYVGAARTHVVYNDRRGRRHSRNSKGSKALVLAAWLADNWVGKEMHAAIRPLGEVYWVLSYNSSF